MDASIDLLLQHVSAGARGRVLWLADEQNSAALAPLANHGTQLTLLSNRFDVAQGAQSLGLDAQFSDWTLSGNTQFDTVYLRVCKEKSVNLHLLRLARSSLAVGGRLIMAGQKNEGIKSIAKQAQDIFDRAAVNKQGKAYLAQLDCLEPTPALDLAQYHQIQTIASWRSLTLKSKPGVYGWDKVDQGSVLLIEAFERYLEAHDPPCASLLDIGCGYGFLTIATGALPCERRVATDNNAAALLCTQLNAAANGLPVDVVAGDCANTVDERFDVILCNPPFHKGFDVESTLTKRFIDAAAKRTARRGTAFFVVNSFIPVEKHARAAFRKFNVLANDGQFKVLALQL